MLPAASVAVQVTVLTPRGKVLPEAGVQVTGRFAADQVVGGGAGVDHVARHRCAEVLPTTRLAGACTSGAVVSTTLTVKELVPLLPAASVAVQVTVVVPSGKTVSEACEQLGFSGPSTMSVALTSP